MIADIPIIKETDILILGTTTAAIAAGTAARQAGKRVVCISSFTYPGEDVCSTMNYYNWGAFGQKAPFCTEIFRPRTKHEQLPSPMKVKRAIENKILEEKMDIIYMSYPIAALRDSNGCIAGAVIANRSGYQAIKASVVIDATKRAQFARTANPSSFREFKPESYLCTKMAAGSSTAETARIPGTREEGFFSNNTRDYIPYKWNLKLKFNGNQPTDFAKADVYSKLSTWYSGMLISSDLLNVKMNDKLKSSEAPQMSSDIENFNLKTLLCEPSLYVLSSMADLAGEATTVFEDPCAAMSLGYRLGKLVASTDTNITDDVSIEQNSIPITNLDILRKNQWFRAENKQKLPMDLNKLPVLGEFDVIVVGGGTAGAPAGISASRAGAKTLIVEYGSSLGGVSTEGRIACYYHGNRCGFTKEIDLGVASLGPNPEYSWDDPKCNPEWKKHWYLRAASEAGAEIWFNALVPGAAVKEGKLCGIAVATPYGYGLVKAKCVVDSTGNADIVAAAGGKVINIEKEHIAVQGCGLSPFNPGWHYQNTDYTFVDDTDIIDITRAFAVGRKKMSESFDLSQIIDSRQRQQIVGDITLDPLDFLANRTFPDTITTAKSNFDSHGFTIHPLFMAKAPDEESIEAHVPFRCLLPKGLERVMSTGLGVSCHRDALPVIRMQPDVQNQGYAAGYAAAMSAMADCDLRDIDIRTLQKHLIEKEILRPEVLTHEDSFPLSDEAIKDAVENGADDYLGLAIIFGNPDRSIPLLVKAHDKSTGEKKIIYARILGLMGNPAGAETLEQDLEANDWDTGWNYKGMGQFGYSLSEIDTKLIALARSGSENAEKIILDKLDQLSAESDFSHLRAITLALEASPTPKATDKLEMILKNLKSCSINDISENINNTSANWCETSERNNELKELITARALFVCGDPNRQAINVLESYCSDLHGHYARHARAIIKKGKK